jgi:lysophospholipase L1-like esterase
MKTLIVRFFVVLALTRLTAGAEPQTPIDPSHFTAPIRVACVGASITAGAGAAPHHSFPDQMQALLGPQWQVRNFGVSGRTVLKKGDHPYSNEKAFTAAQAYKPDVVIICLGSNDTKPKNWVHHDEFIADYKDLIATFQNLASKPRVYACRLPPVPPPGNYGINETNLDVELTMIDQAAAEQKADVIDMHAALVGHPELFVDRVHPNTAGAALMAQAAAKALTGKTP